MEPVSSGNNCNHQEEIFPGRLYSNDRSAMEETIDRKREASKLAEPMISENMIAVISAIPSTIITYMSIHWYWFPSSEQTVIDVLAFAVGGTLALHFQALLLLARSTKR